MTSEVLAGMVILAGWIGVSIGLARSLARTERSEAGRWRPLSLLVPAWPLGLSNRSAKAFPMHAGPVNAKRTRP